LGSVPYTRLFLSFLSKERDTNVLTEETAKNGKARVNRKMKGTRKIQRKMNSHPMVMNGIEHPFDNEFLFITCW
jgi:hypothetical protein